jgi:hypothetical protein
MISIELRGRFGNHLFQYCAGRVLAEKNNANFCVMNTGVFTNGANENKTFLGTKIFDCYIGDDYVEQSVIFNEGGDKYNNDFWGVKDNTHIKGFFQSEKYFMGYENNIREWLKLPYIDFDDNVCTIHFRAQDGYLKQNYLLPKEYFDESKNIALNSNPNIKFLVITDNIKMAKEYFPDDEIIMNDMKKDFEYLYHSKYKIISNSTFSWWAAWLSLPNSNLVIAPNKWLNYNSKSDDFFPKNIKTKGFKYI